MKLKSYLLCLLIFMCISVVLLPCVCLAETCEKWVGKIVSVQGSVQAKRVGEAQWQNVNLNETFCPGDMIRIQEKSRAAIALINQPILRLDENSTITLGGLKEERTSVIEMLKGAAHFFSRVARNLEVQTAFVNAGVEGTEFFIKVEEDKTFMSIFEGKILASNEAGSLIVTSGQSAVAEAGKAPVLVVVVRPQDAVQWTLYYPPITYRYEEIREDDPRFYTQRASSLLSVGRVEEAEAEIKKALYLDPKNSQALALKSIIAVAQNEKLQAINLATAAVESDPKSAIARIAFSYAKQASFDLDEALNCIKEAVKLEPENALAWSRLAELELSFGRLNEALRAAQQAVTFEPNLSRTHTILGFVYLTKVKIKESKEAFEKAILLDQADPLPRLGYGLAKIREGLLSEGRRDIEIALSLDPNNALVRSYLGKAYFEEKKDKLATDQFNAAKDFDHLDPTPFFYDAIHKQTTNRPIEALHDLQKAIELNDNRAVYRSRLLLDEDLAARSASLARIYGDLGFQQLALVEGWKSVNIDPSNHSAHRFLADSYSVLPRHEIARVSELLQSQLLQPINITPIQPRLAESNLFLISAGGPGTLSFNEFNPLFNRNQITLQASGILGDNSTSGEETVVSGIYKRASFSAGYTHFQTDGFRKNNDQDDDIANVFLQLELSPKTSIQTEYRYRDIENGDLQLRFFKDDFLKNLREKDETNLLRFGFHHALSPGSDLIANLQYQNRDGSQGLEPIPGLFRIDTDTDENAYGGELQYLFRSRYINIVGGIGYFDINSTDKINSQILLPPPDGGSFLQIFDGDVRHTNIYLYTYINFPKTVTFTLGGSGDFFNADDPLTKDTNQFNPKIGIVWNPSPDTTLRAAVFRVLKRTLITDQTLEPTQVAGFNQFFDEANATDSWRYGGAIDQKFSKNIYGGAEYTYRDLKVPFNFVNVATGITTLREADWKEKIFRAYLFWTPKNWLALSAKYEWERFDRDERFAEGAKTVETNYFPLGVNFFHPSGLSASLKGTYINQHGDFERQLSIGTFENGKDSFWLFDAAISYRLPKRYGIITVGATNLFNEEFQYLDTDIDNPRIQPERFFFVKLTLSI